MVIEHLRFSHGGESVFFGEREVHGGGPAVARKPVAVNYRAARLGDEAGEQLCVEHLFARRTEADFDGDVLAGFLVQRVVHFQQPLRGDVRGEVDGGRGRVVRAVGEFLEVLREKRDERRRKREGQGDNSFHVMLLFGYDESIRHCAESVQYLFSIARYAFGA